MSFPLVGVTVPDLADFQFSYNGLLMGVGTTYGLVSYTGIGDLPTVRSGDVARSRTSGESMGLNFFGGRDITVDFQVLADTPAELQSALLDLATALIVGPDQELPLWIKLPGLPLLSSMCSPRNRSTATDVSYSNAFTGHPAVQWHATDPLLYGAPQSATVGAPDPSGGLSFPVTFPVSFGGGSSTADLFPVNDGNTTLHGPVLVITGPCTNPKVSNDETGWSLTFSNPSQTGYTLNAGDTLTVDLDTHSVQYLVNGTTIPSTVRSWVVPGSIWPNAMSIGGLIPGSQTIQFSTADGSGVAGTLTFEYASAYLL